MRERSGDHLILGTMKYWLDDRRTSMRLPRTGGGCCAEPGCFHSCFTVYCDAHYPVLRRFDPTEIAECMHNAKKWVDIVNKCGARGGTVCLRRKERRIRPRSEQIKAFILLMDFLTLNNHNLNQSWKNVIREKLTTPDRGRMHGDSCCGGSIESCELSIRYAFFHNADEFPPVVYPLYMHEKERSH